MRILLNFESLRPPVTGIGRYTFELAAGLSARTDIEDVRGFLGAHMVAARALIDSPNDIGAHAGSAVATDANAWSARLRGAVRAVPGAYELRRRWQERGLRKALRATRHTVYHEPNYILRTFDAPCISTIHDLSFVHYPEFHPRERVAHLKRHLPDTLRRADHIVTDTEFVRREVIELLGVPATRVTAIALGVDPIFHPRSSTEIAAVLDQHALLAGHYLLSVSTLEPRKNLKALVTAYLALPRDLLTRYPLVLAGTFGWCSDALEALLDTPQARRHVRRLGYVPARDLPALYAGATACAFPSLYEGFGLPLLEAMASGTPALSSAATAMAEVAGDAALLIDPHDIEALRNGLEQVLEDEDWRAGAITRGVRRARAYSWTRCVDETVAIYREISD